MSLKNLHYALLLDEYRKDLNPKEKEYLREEIRKNSNITIKNYLICLRIQLIKSIKQNN